MHSYLELHRPQMVRPLTLPALTGEASKHICKFASQAEKGEVKEPGQTEVGTHATTPGSTK